VGALRGLQVYTQEKKRQRAVLTRTLLYALRYKYYTTFRAWRQAVEVPFVQPYD